MAAATAQIPDISTLPSTSTSLTSRMILLKPALKPAPTLYFGNKITNELASLLKRLEPDCIYLVTNRVLLDLYGGEILKCLEQEKLKYRVVTLEDSEDNKNFHTLEFLCETLVEENISKASVIVGFGGGCLTNIAGLAAGLIFRGIRYVEMTSTLMGITDSCLSNKQAVNGAHGKNHFGMYYAPVFLFSDTHYLASEPILGKKAAIAEGIKNGLISDASLIDYFVSAMQRPLDTWDELDFHNLAYRIICSKLRILEQDPSEKALAMTLEYGHTFGHAIEFLTHGKVHHGVAVAKGMCIAAELACRLGLISQDIVDRHYYLFGNLLGLDLAIPQEVGVEEILAAMKSDNKKTNGGTKFVLLKKVGECMNPDGDFQVFVDEPLVRSVLTEYKEKSQAAVCVN
jgi:3-dehydroquinate synthetase